MVKEKRSNLCLTFRPTVEQFSKPFTEYVEEIFKKHPDCACFKVIPPRGWKPRNSNYDVSTIDIQTPIRQHAFGRAGAYTCILEEQPPMRGDSFKVMATAPDNRPPQRGHADDDMLERAFWSNITFNAPLYGADTDLSLFDNRIPYGWNLRKLDCLLKKEFNVDIPGVSKPYTYVGSWRSFFGWHKEDCDLMSVNYLHLGAPKVWYSVAPSDAAKFDAMCQHLFPEAFDACPHFTRHKSIMISPNVLRQFGIPFVQAKQMPGQFIVLNAATYHGGFNMGFNIAEAVNFAVPSWLEVGRWAEQCECGALPDGVQIDMSKFFPDDYTSNEESESDSSSSESDSSSSESDSSSSESEDEDESDMDALGTLRRSRKPSEKALESIFMKENLAEALKLSRAVPKQGRPIKRKVTGSTSTKDGRRPPGRPCSKETEQKRQKMEEKAFRAVVKMPELNNSGRAADLEVPRKAVFPSWKEVAEPRPVAIVYKDNMTKSLKFELVHRLKKASRKDNGEVWVGPLQQDTDGLYRPAGDPKPVQLGLSYPKLVRVKTQWSKEGGAGFKRKGGWKLSTKEELILGMKK